MTTYSFSDLEKVQVDEGFDDNNWSEEIDNALNRGFDNNYPIVVDEDGIILDGNHRYIAFLESGRVNELLFVRVNFFDFCEAKRKAIERNEMDSFIYDNEYFYSIIRSIAKN